MIEFKNITNELVVETKRIPQNCGEVVEQIDIDNYDSNYKYYLELKCPKDRKYISAELRFAGNRGEVLLPNLISTNIGKIYVQLIIRDTNGKIINKSFISQLPTYIVEPSINAVEKIDNGRVNDCIEYIIQKDNDLDNLQQDITTKLANGEFNGKDGTIIKINGTDKSLVNFDSDPQIQINQLKQNRTKIDLLFSGSTKSYTINNIDKYNFFLFICSLDSNDSRLSVFVNKQGNYFSASGKSAFALDAEYGVCIKRVNNTYTINSAGYFSKGFIWEERIGTGYESNYNIAEIYGIKCE